MVRTCLLLAVLAISIAGNVGLGVHRIGVSSLPKVAEPQSGPVGARSFRSATGAQDRNRARGEQNGDTPTLAACQDRLAERQAELGRVKAEFEKRLLPSEQFERESSDALPRDDLKRELARVLSVDGGLVHWNLECRAHTCKLQILAEDNVDPNGWMKPLQQNERIGQMVKSMMFQAATPSYDALTREPLHEFNIYLVPTQANSLDEQGIAPR